jgi:hypothetical protein
MICVQATISFKWNVTFINLFARRAPFLIPSKALHLLPILAQAAMPISLGIAPPLTHLNIAMRDHLPRRTM